MDRLNQAINAITQTCTSEELIALFTSITIPISKIKTISEVIADPLVQKKILSTQDPKTGTRVTLAPPPHMTEHLEQNQRQMAFPPRFGEHNHEIYGQVLGYSAEQLAQLKDDGVI